MKYLELIPRCFRHVIQLFEWSHHMCSGQDVSLHLVNIWNIWSPALLALGLTVCLCFLRPVRQVWHAELRLVSSERCSACTHMSYITYYLVSTPTCTVQHGRHASLLDKRWRQLFRMCHSGILWHPTSKEVAILTLISWSASEFLVE